MKAFKITGFVVIGLWMAFTTWRLEYSIWATEKTCGLFMLAATQLKPEAFSSRDMFRSPNFLCPGAMR